MTNYPIEYLELEKPQPGPARQSHGEVGAMQDPEMTTIRREITVRNKLGLHARPAAMLVQLTSKFNSEITVSKNDMQVNAKSIMGVMMLAAECGSVLVLTADGEDAERALEEVEGLFARKFNEEE